MIRAGLLLTVVLTLSGVAGATRSGPYFVEGGHFTVEPSQGIDLSGTSSFEITDFRWLRWTPTEARATGTFLTNACNPSCGAGNYTAQPARFELSHVVRCDGKRVFDHFVVTGKSGRVLTTGTFRSLGYLLGC
jgi:hypothetical protein